MIKNGFVAVAATIGLLGMVASTSHADVKLVSQVNVSKQSTATPVSRTVTAYFQNNNARVDSGNGAVLIYDYTARTISVLNTAQKTYFVKQLPPAGQHPNQGKLSQFVNITTDGNVLPVPHGATTTVAGVPTKPYSIRGNVTAQTKQPVLGGVPLSTAVHVEGTFQGAASSLVIPTATADKINTILQELLSEGWTPGPLADDFMQLKVVPMKASVVVTHTGNLKALAAAHQGSGRFANRTQGGTVQEGPTTVAMEVLSLDEKTTLSSSLFTVPSDYKQVEAPKQRLGGGNLGDMLGSR